MSNNWNQQPMTNQTGERNGTPRARSGGMLREYRQQQQQQQQYYQYSPVSPPPSQGQNYNPYSPVPLGTIPQQERQPAWPAAQSWPSPSPQGWVENARQAVRYWSGKIATVQGGLFQQPRPATPSMVLYRPGENGVRLPPKGKPWKRSHAMRVAMFMHQRRLRWKKRQPHLGRKIALGTLLSLLLLLVVAASSTVSYA